MVLSSCFRGPEKGKWLDNQSGRAEATSGWVTISKRECVIGKQIQTSLLYRTFPHGRRGDYNGVPKTLNGRHVGVQRQSSGSWIIFLICKRSFFFLFSKNWKDVFLFSILSNCSAEDAQISGLILLRTEFDPSHVIKPLRDLVQDHEGLGECKLLTYAYIISYAHLN